VRWTSTDWFSGKTETPVDSLRALTLLTLASDALQTSPACGRTGGDGVDTIGWRSKRAGPEGRGDGSPGGLLVP
jgi:hypothetical protein